MVAATKRDHCSDLIINVENKSRAISSTPSRRKGRGETCSEQKAIKLNDERHIIDVFSNFFGFAGGTYELPCPSGIIDLFLFLFPTNPVEIRNIIQEMENKRSCDWTGISCDIVRNAVNYVSDPLMLHNK